jgi:hypothetical protein
MVSNEINDIMKRCKKVSMRTKRNINSINDMIESNSA